MKKRMSKSEINQKIDIYKYVFLRKFQLTREKTENFSYKEIFLPKEAFDLAEKSVRGKEKLFNLLFFLLNALYPIVTILLFLKNDGKTADFIKRISITLPILNIVLLFAVVIAIYISVSEFIYKSYLKKTKEDNKL